MRTLIVLAVLFGAGYWTASVKMRDGKVEQYLDAHASPTRNAAIEYYWAVSLHAIHHDAASIYRYRRVLQKYPESPYAPRAWVDIINMLDDQNDREGVFREAAKFLALYPDHPKAEYVRKKVYFLQSGF